jgi:hypothetical protein
MSHSDICNTRYAQKKGWESNWQNCQFDSRPLKVENWPDPGVCRWSVIHRRKALEDNYKFTLDLISIGGLSRELWIPKVPGVQIRIVSRLLLGSPGKKCHSDVGATGKCKECYIGEDGGFPEVRVMVSHVSPRSPVACCRTKIVPECELTNLMIGLMHVWVTK